MFTTDLLRTLLLSSSLLGAAVAAPTARSTEAPGNLGPELIVVLHQDLQARGESDSGTTPSPAVLDILKKHKAAIAPIFTPVSENDKRSLLQAREEIEVVFPDLSVFFKIEAPKDQLESIAQDLRQSGQVDGAYVRPGVTIPVIKTSVQSDKLKKRQSTPNFESHQGYLKNAPFGFGAVYGNALAGGLGQGVRVVDLEYSWNFSHEDLIQNQGGVIQGSVSQTYWDHGTGVAGIVGGDVNSFGIRGFAPSATFYGASWIGSQSDAAAIQASANFLAAGDVMLLEAQYGGPNNGAYIAVEWYPDVFAAIQYATNKGIIVVEAAGNGNQDLDSSLYAQPQSGFPSAWRNPYNISNPSSGAIMVGAGAPPPEHSTLEDNGPARSRLPFSNYGKRIDTQAWGSEVTTSTTSGELLNNGVNRSYTDLFSGTSSASAIVTGVMGVVMGVLRASNKRVSPANARVILRNTGGAQQDGYTTTVAQRIARQADIAEILPLAQGLAIPL